MRLTNRLVAACGTISIMAGVAQAGYQLETTYDTTNFFKSFDFFTGEDPTQGFVDYVDRETANKEGLAGYAKGGIFMGVDHTTKYPPNGRKSVRVTSQKAFTHGLFIADIAHMPGSICGTWPAFWMFGPEWPANGEIDILEGVNAQTKNSVTLHTKPGCHISNHGTLASTKFASSNCGAEGTSAGCGQHTADHQNYGDGFNAIGGGVYATEWTSDHIAIWFFPRSKIPQDIQAENPNPRSWGTPVARFVGGPSCAIDNHFSKHQIIIDTTFCGAWAGSPDVWGSDPECSALASTCKDYVSGNPAHFAESFWVFNSIKVYQHGAGNDDQPTKPLPSATRTGISAKPKTTTTTTTPAQNPSQTQPHIPEVTFKLQPALAALSPPPAQAAAPKAQPPQAPPAQPAQAPPAQPPQAPPAQPAQAPPAQPPQAPPAQPPQAPPAQPPQAPPAQPAQAPPAQPHDESWAGQVWNGMGWNAKRSSEILARIFRA
ncbi:hypothetical protein E4U41_004029 [Claviceps citrina]|nr:hypothetical protein E4U41_004029 [Claviceps citrina]